MTTTPDPNRWFTDLLSAQQAAWQSLGAAGATPIASAPQAAPSAGAASPWPSLPWPQLPGMEALDRAVAGKCGTTRVMAKQGLERHAGVVVASRTRRGRRTSAQARVPPSPADADKRFAAQAWRDDPRFDGLARAYLGQSEMLRKALDAAPLDERSKAQWGFALRQVDRRDEPGELRGDQPGGAAARARDRRREPRRGHAAVHRRTWPRAASP